MSGQTLYEFESEPYGLTHEDVAKVIEERLDTLRIALTLNRLNTKVERESI